MTRTVLVVDDEPRILQLYARWLQSDYEVETAADGETALSTVDDDVDVVLLDRRMPDLRGEEVLARIRDRGYDCWVLMVTAVEPEMDVVDMPFDDYLVKPVEVAELRSAIEGVLERERYDERLREYFESLAKLGLLESKMDPEALAQSEEYQRLKVEQRRRQEAVSLSAERLREAGDREDLFVEAPIIDEDAIDRQN